MKKSRKALSGVACAWLLFFTLGLSACERDTTAPADMSAGAELADFAFSTLNVSNPLDPGVPPVWHLPSDLALTSAQEAQIRALLEAFRDATRADHEALAEILRAAHDAARAGKTRDEIRVILEQGEPIRQRLVEAERALRQDVLAVLTAEQRAWLESHQPRGCSAPNLTDAQRTEISALIAAFEQANRADIAAVENAFQRARAAQRNGASRREIKAIVESVAPQMMRLHAAHAALAAAIQAMLTPEQRGSGCGLPPRGPRG